MLYITFQRIFIALKKFTTSCTMFYIFKLMLFHQIEFLCNVFDVIGYFVETLISLHCRFSQIISHISTQRASSSGTRKLGNNENSLLSMFNSFEKFLKYSQLSTCLGIFFQGNLEIFDTRTLGFDIFFTSHVVWETFFKTRK